MRNLVAAAAIGFTLVIAPGDLEGQSLPVRLTGEFGNYSVSRSNPYTSNCGGSVTRAVGEVRTRGPAYLGFKAEQLMPGRYDVDLMCLFGSQSGDTVTYGIRGGIDPTTSTRVGLLAGASVGGKRLAAEIEVRAGLMRGQEGWAPTGEEPGRTTLPWMSRSTGVLLLNHLVIRWERGRTRLSFTEEVHVMKPEGPGPQQGEEPFTTRTRRGWRGYSAWTIGLRF